VRGTAITIRCDCGAARPVHYGERWTCECGKTWNTAQIPAEEYWGTMRVMRRYRLRVWAISALVVAVLIPLALVFSYGLMILPIIVLGAFYFFVLPKWRGRVLAELRDRPSWNLHPE